MAKIATIEALVTAIENRSKEDGPLAAHLEFALKALIRYAPEHTLGYFYYGNEKDPASNIETLLSEDQIQVSLDDNNRVIIKCDNRNDNKSRLQGSAGAVSRLLKSALPQELQTLQANEIRNDPDGYIIYTIGTDDDTFNLIIGFTKAAMRNMVASIEPYSNATHEKFVAQVRKANHNITDILDRMKTTLQIVLGQEAENIYEQIRRISDTEIRKISSNAVNTAYGNVGKLCRDLGVDPKSLGQDASRG